MRRAASVVLLVSLLSFNARGQAKPRLMTNDEQSLSKAQAGIQQFEDTAQPEGLQEAFLTLQNVRPFEEPERVNRLRLRRTCLTLWLQLIQLLDSLTDPQFNPEDVPETLVQPPATTGGIVYPPGADPALIADPAARAAYAQKVEANRRKIDAYRLQLQLRRLADPLPQRAAEFIRANYTATPQDEDDLRSQVEAIIKTPQRKEALLTVLKTPRAK